MPWDCRGAIALFGTVFDQDQRRLCRRAFARRSTIFLRPLESLDSSGSDLLLLHAGRTVQEHDHRFRFPTGQANRPSLMKADEQMAKINPAIASIRAAMIRICLSRAIPRLIRLADSRNCIAPQSTVPVPTLIQQVNQDRQPDQRKCQ